MTAGDRGVEGVPPWRIVAGPLLLLAVSVLLAETREDGFGRAAIQGMGAERWLWLGAAAGLVVWPVARRGLLRLGRGLAGVDAGRGGLGLRMLGLAAILAWMSPGPVGADAPYLMALLEEGRVVLWREPLDFWIHGMLWRLASPLGLSEPASLYVATSVLGGLGFVAALPGLARAVGDGPEGASLVTAGILSSGVVFVFCGWVESYALAWAALTWFLAEGSRSLRTGRPRVRAFLWLGPAIALHPATGAASLAAIPLLGLVGRGQPPLRRTVRVGVAVVAILWPPLLTLALLAASHGGLPAVSAMQLGGADDAWFMPWWTPAQGIYAKQPLLSWGHLRDVLTQFVLVAPAAVCALSWLGGPADGGTRAPGLDAFLGLASVGTLLLAVTWNPDVGAIGDWDLLSVYAIPVGAWSAGWTARRVPREQREDVAGAWLIAGVATLAPWIVAMAWRGG